MGNENSSATPISGEADFGRKAAMALLAQATAQEMNDFWTQWANKPQVETLRGPEIGLVMMRGRIGGGGAPFNLGEATVTRATVRLANGAVGHAYALGRSSEKVRLAAIFDALWQEPAYRQTVEETVLAPIAQRLNSDLEDRRAETAATKVDFFTMVRGDN
ncbi:alpha-D-ribose 1-methylphosphonate 5-triphosphate synthase subunit PhnG [Phyllobacterium sp. 1468]|uniref:phosphonate C-P lyase system protein PhnG n=1 Tax=Phyllobacterium sp. 1468 TaxID=2817759 RepID=UPI00285493EE|nr:phosphonate C-P lyase system protein PhnG [Phyllobacterium sp. 1468]MDR6632834.1 alpha-D-ribose 1-methylphosphonate 5-triphosphate synthase subunit PhnG [Phyllobacterium sp. 1468]